VNLKAWASQGQPFQRYGWCPPNFKWFTWPYHALSEMFCHPRPRTCYDQPNYYIWSFYLHV